MVEGVIPPSVRDKFEVFSYRNAATILSQNYSEQFAQIIHALEKFHITTGMIRMPAAKCSLRVKPESPRSGCGQGPGTDTH